MPSMTVSLPPELAKIVQSRVESGLYNTPSDVVGDALRNQADYEQFLYEIKLERLKKALEPGVHQARAGIFADYSLEKLQKELDDEADRERSKETVKE